ncbi:nucleoporin [Sistotremastrum niveocremeum HHB9708]|uniref:Nucleoporin n=1 Tax=Sistotremastrum niveocremeum HHB9708 TaxID=1314777 RepID=A0A164XMU8_9AGAM|nr:nucleoporin [Sistotremastrum niveocremeum HHB9708]
MANNPSFGASASLNTQQPASAARSSNIDLASLEHASKTIQDQFVQDSRLVPDLNELLPGGISPPPSYVPQHETPWQLYHAKTEIKIPTPLFSHFQNTTTQSDLGLFVEIGRAWITIDNKLFLWDYVEGNEIDSFTEQSEVITSVTLLKPKSGIFVDEINSLLVVCTRTSVLLIGVSATNVPSSSRRARKTLKLYATDMVVSTKLVSMSGAVGTSTGRIFMAGADGFLYELDYSSSESWFSAKVALKNHSISYGASLLPSFLSGASEATIKSIVVDDSRNCLYTLSNTNAITVMSLGSNGLDPHLTQKFILRDVCHQAQSISPGNTLLEPRAFDIVSLHVVSPSESKGDCHLIAVTSKSARIYLSHRGGTGFNYPSFAGSKTSGPTGLRVIYVRGPPTSLAHPSGRPEGVVHPGLGPQPDPPRAFVISSVGAAYYASGLLLASQQVTEPDGSLRSIILCTFPDLATTASLKIAAPQYPNYPSYSLSYQRPALTENLELHEVDGHTLIISELPSPSLSSGNQASSPVAFNELVTQFSSSPREFLLLSNFSLTPVIKLRPVDVLNNLILQDSRHELELYYNNYGRDQTCAMLFAILARNSFLQTDSSVGDSGAAAPRLGGRIDARVNARQILLSIGGKPTLSTVRIGHIDFSGKLQGLTLYFGRLIRSIWNTNIVTAKFALNVPDSELVTLHSDLQSLRELCETDPFLFQVPPGEHRSAGAQDEAWKAELSASASLISLIAQTVEALSFVLLLHDYNLSELVQRLDPADQQRLIALTYSQLISTNQGREIAGVMVNSVINQQISLQINVDTISEVLQQRCGSFCSTDDVMLYKAEENVRKAGETRNAVERNKILLESLRLFSKGSRHLTSEKLEDVALEYRRLHYAKGAIELPLRCAQDWDNDNSGFDHWQAGCPPNDPRTEAYQSRIRCYDSVLDTLQTFDTAAAQAKGSSGLDIVVDDSEAISQAAYRSAIGSQDPVFHSHLYDWLIKRGSADELLESNSPFLESYLQREPLTLQKAELLWQYYVKMGQFLRSAEILVSLSESSRFSLSLDQRIEYLTLAVSNAKSHSASDGGRQETAISLLTEYEEKLEVARAQLQIFHTILREFPEPSEWERQKLQELGSALIPISSLYEDYADALNLPEMKLLLLHVSDHQDQHLVTSIWRFLFDRFSTAESLEDELNATANLVITQGRQLYPSESAFPTEYIMKTLEDMTMRNRDHIPVGWGPRVLTQAGVPHHVVFNLLSRMYDSQVPPYNVQTNVQALSADLAVVLSDWVNSVTRDRTRAARAEFPADKIDRAIDVFLRELAPDRGDTRKLYEEVKLKIRREF